MSQYVLKEFLNKNLNDVSSLSSAFFALKEYCSSSIEKLQNVASGKVNFSSLVLPTKASINNVSQYVAVRYNTEDVRKLLNDEVDTITAVINESGDEITVTANDFNEVYQDSIQDFQIQKEFIGECLDATAADAQNFVTKVAAKFPLMSPSKLQLYGELFTGGDKLQALKAWVSQIKVNKVTYDSQYITLVSREEYTGVSVWSVVIDDFVSSISNFFDKVWQGIQDIMGFFERLWNGIVRLGKYLISKAFRYLSSNLSASGSKLGILDFPVLQYDFGSCTISPRRDNDNKIIDYTVYVNIESDDIDALHDLSLCSNTIPMKGGYKYMGFGYNSQYQDELRLIAGACCLTNTVDPQTGLVTGYVTKLFDVVIPNPNSDQTIIDGFVLRLGFTDDLHFILSIYPTIRQQVLDNYDDATIFNWIRLGFSDVWQMISNIGLPITSAIDPSVISPNYKVLSRNYLLSKIISPLSANEEQANTPVDFASHYLKLRRSDLDFTPSSDLENNLSYDHGLVALVYHGFLPYIMLMSPVVELDLSYYTYLHIWNGLLYRDPNTQALSIVVDYWKYIFPFNDEMYLSIANDTPLDLSDYKFLPNDFDTSFKPYSSYEITPAAIHLQTLNERAKEIEWTIIAVIIAVAAIAISIKAIPFLKNLSANAEIARGQCDSFAWDDEVDWSDPDSLRQYKKLRRKARKLEKLQSLFGKASVAASSFALSSISDDSASVNANAELITLIHG